jgi:hypothetical protein
MVRCFVFAPDVVYVYMQLSNCREEGHIKLKVRRQSVLQDSMDAVESIEPADMRKTFRLALFGVFAGRCT